MRPFRGLALPRRDWWSILAGTVLTVDQAKRAIDAGSQFVVSPGFNPAVVEYCKMARTRGLRAIIAGAGLSAALPGVAAAHTELPVIGVPISAGTLGGIDALLSVAQMPPGVPVAAVGIDNAKNAGVLAARIING